MTTSKTILSIHATNFGYELFMTNLDEDGNTISTSRSSEYLDVDALAVTFQEAQEELSTAAAILRATGNDYEVE